MARKTDAYVDTSALIAFLDVSDSYHSLFRRLFADPPPLFTTTLVITEGHAWFLKRYDRTRALQFMAAVDDMKFLDITSVGNEEIRAAGALLRRFPDQDLTLVDAAGLHAMKARRSRWCWSTDFHLGLTGVPLIIHQQ